MIYSQIIDGQITKPAFLPIKYRNISNFYLLDEPVLNSYGFYRIVEGDKPSYNPTTEKLNSVLTLKNKIIEKSYFIESLSEEEISLKRDEIKLALVFKVESFLDETVQAKDYKNILHACSYAQSTIPKYKEEALSVIAWRDSVWIKAYEIENDILEGRRNIPTEKEFLLELPIIEWPQ